MKIEKKKRIASMVYLGTKVFENISEKVVQSVAFVSEKGK